MSNFSTFGCLDKQLRGAGNAVYLADGYGRFQKCLAATFNLNKANKAAALCNNINSPKLLFIAPSQNPVTLQPQHPNRPRFSFMTKTPRLAFVERSPNLVLQCQRTTIQNALWKARCLSKMGRNLLHTMAF